MADGWLSPGTIMGALGVLMSAASLTYTRRVDRRGRSSDRPIVNIDLQPPNASGWHDLWISIENHTPGVWILETISFPRAPDALAIVKGDIVVDNGQGGHREGTPRISDARPGPIKVALRTDPAGSVGLWNRPADCAQTHLWLSCSKARRRLAIRLSLRSLEAATRPITLTEYRRTHA